METYLALRQAKTMVVKLLRTAGGHWFWRQNNDGLTSFGLFFSSADALSGDGEDDDDEGVVCWLN
jgi:hypothetical protein